ncbi:hypothetical protein [Plebeiibacterium sediminum]|uniref:Uncharacterized protein n=1 Tax=Plebeiibacterium sediminum TaxID=2992112 RepID=A0AAE3M0N2_9BACT|nr:hypothetical protein [Plebeiobacterium sediminum]MCW3784934.1 hypothetical protein [Plebeiobacterium sediminum]
MKNAQIVRDVTIDLTPEIIQSISKIDDKEISTAILSHIRTDSQKLKITRHKFKKLVGLAHLLNLLVIQGNDFIIESFNN